MSDLFPKFHPVFDGVEIGVGTWAWGDRLFWGYRTSYTEQDIQEAFMVSLEAGLIFFDTAESYGQGMSETLLGRYTKITQKQIRIATKFLPYPWRLTGNALLKALKSSLKRLDRPKVELYQMHWPFPPVRIETWMGAMIDAVQAGLIDGVGVSNYDQSQTQRAHDALQREGIRLASNQVEYHLLNRKIEKNGLLQFCREQGIKVIAYSPLAQGVLTGKYTPQNPLRGVRARKYSSHFLHRATPLIVLLKKIGLDHGGKNAAQVAINWCICKGTLPIPGAKNMQQAEQNAGAVGWKLTETEIAQLDEASDWVIKGT